MCGIVGLIMKGNNGLFSKNEDSFYDMLYADALRGFDSTGVIGVEHTGAWHWAKEATAAANFIPKFKPSQVGRDIFMRGKAIIGHNRKKTIGEVKDETAHPFVVDNEFAMVHNGTLHNHKQLADVEVDSNALAIVLKKALDEDNHIEALNETLGKVRGAYAVVAYHQKKDKVYILRNSERPLSLIETDDAIYFASEFPMAAWILNRRGYGGDNIKIKPVVAETLYTFDLLTNELKEDSLSPKKSSKSSHTHHGTTSTAANSGTYRTTTATGLTKKITEKMQKWFRKNYIGKTLSFWIDDYVEEEFPKTIEDGATRVMFMGSDDTIKYAHRMEGVVDLAHFGIESEEEMGATRWVAFVEAVEFYGESAIFKMSSARPAKKPVIDTADGHKTYREIQMAKSLDQLDTEWKAYGKYLPNWQKEITQQVMEEKLEEAIKEEGDGLRAAFSKLGREAVLEEAEQKGYTLKSQIIGGEFERLIREDTGEVVYESSVVVH
jgi:hypothetical protein